MRNRSENQVRGILGEERIKKKLEKNGYIVIEHLKDGFPDLYISFLVDRGDHDEEEFYTIEAKSIHGIQRGKVGAIYITTAELKRLEEGAKEKNAKFAIVIEVITGHRENLYFWIDGVVAKQLRTEKGISLTVWQIIRFGGRL